MFNPFGGSKQDKQEQLALLHEYHSRLRSVIGELLAQVDEADQQSHYDHIENKQWSKQLRDACSDLVKLGDDLPKIERLLGEKRIAEGRAIILESCKKAVTIARKVQAVKRPPP